MTPREWAAIVAWLTPRLPIVAKWEEATIAAYFDDLKDWEHEDVFNAVCALYDQGVDGYKLTGGLIRRHLRETGIHPDTPCPHMWIPHVDNQEYCVRCRMTR